MKRSISFQKGSARTRASIKHNERTPETAKQLENKGNHINAALTKYNKIFISKNVIDEYDKLFGDAVKEYNEKQRAKHRLNRCISEKHGGYYRYVSRNLQTPTVREFVVQVGRMGQSLSDDETENRKVYDDIYEQYLDDFQKRNKTLDVVSAVVHHDEGDSKAPHMHIVAIPIAHGYKTGVSVRPNLDKALGLNRTHKKFAEWTENERNRLAEVAEKYDVEREVVHADHKHLEPEQYRELMREAEETAQKILDDAKTDVQKVTQKVEDAKSASRFWQNKTDEEKLTYTRLSDENRSLDEKIQQKNAQLKGLVEGVDDKQLLYTQLIDKINKNYDAYNVNIKKLQAERTKIWQDIKRLQESKKNAIADLKSSYLSVSQEWEEFGPQMRKMREENWNMWHSPSQCQQWNEATEKLRQARQSVYTFSNSGSLVGLAFAFILSVRAKKAEEQVQAIREERNRVIKENNEKIQQMHSELDAQKLQVAQKKDELQEVKKALDEKFDDVNTKISVKLHNARSEYARLNALKGSLSQMSEKRLRELQKELKVKDDISEDEKLYERLKLDFSGLDDDSSQLK